MKANSQRKKRSIKEIEPLLAEIKKTIQKLYTDRLVDVFLYGSFARNNATQDSDIDIAVVLKARVNQSKEIDRTCDALYDFMLKSGELISVFPVSESEMKDSVWPLYRHIKSEGKRLTRG